MCGASVEVQGAANSSFIQPSRCCCNAQPQCSLHVCMRSSPSLSTCMHTGICCHLPGRRGISNLSQSCNPAQLSPVFLCFLLFPLCHHSKGKRLLHTWFLRPMASLRVLTERHDAIDVMMAAAESTRSLQAALKKVGG